MDGAALQTMALSMTEGWHETVREIVGRQDPVTIFP
jgi:hypothetical protein